MEGLLGVMLRKAKRVDEVIIVGAGKKGGGY